MSGVSIALLPGQGVHLFSQLRLQVQRYPVFCCGYRASVRHWVPSYNIIQFIITFIAMVENRQAAL